MDRLTEGIYAMRVECPECEQVVQFQVQLKARLTLDSDGGQLRPVLVTKSSEHSCRIDPQQDVLPFPSSGQVTL